MPALRQLLLALGLNVVPIAGVTLGGWSLATAMVLYWFENVINTVLMTITIFAHQRQTNKRGHWVSYTVDETRMGKRRRRQGQMPFYKSFLMQSGLFTLVHGIFLFFFIFVTQTPIESESLRNGLIVVAGFQGLNFAFDLIGIGDRPFAWVKRVSEGMLGRVVLIHLALILGVFAGAQFFVPFAVMKLLADVASVIGHTVKYKESETPPAWLTPLMNRLRPGEDFAAYWAEEHRRTLEANARDEAAQNVEAQNGRR
jgi:hypothetical protein